MFFWFANRLTKLIPTLATMRVVPNYGKIIFHGWIQRKSRFAIFFHPNFISDFVSNKRTNHNVGFNVKSTVPFVFFRMIKIWRLRWRTPRIGWPDHNGPMTPRRVLVTSLKIRVSKTNVEEIAHKKT